MTNTQSNIVVIGKSGQLAFELAKKINAPCLGRDDIDLTNPVSLAHTLDSLKSDSIINASAYTAVDKAESDTASAFALNQAAVANLAQYCASRNIFLVHVSTDYVFNGENCSPYRVDDAIEPKGVYGESKAAGEAELLKRLPKGSALIRTSWVYSSQGNNFVKTMLRLMGDKPQLGVVDDQIGTPTWCASLAQACIEAASSKIAGVYHWSDEGVCSWFDFACAIQDLGMEKGLLTKKIPIMPIPSSAYPTPAKRPFYSVLDKSVTRDTFSTPLTHWRAQLSDMLDELK